MARRPEKPKSRGPQPEGPLDWLKEPEQSAPDTSETGASNLLGQNGGWRPNPPTAVPLRPATGPRRPPDPQPFNGLEPPDDPEPPRRSRPRDSARSSTDSGPTTLSRRAARARREAEGVEALEAAQPRNGTLTYGFGQLPPIPPTGTSPPPAPNGSPTRMPTGTLPSIAEQLAVHPSGPLPQRESTPRRESAQEREPGQGREPVRDRERGTRSKDPEPALTPGPRRRQVATWLTIGALVLALWSSTAFIDSTNVILTGLASLSLVVTVFALPVIAIGVASRHVVPTAIAVAAALLPWSLVVSYAAAGPAPTAVGSSKTLRVMSVDGAQGRASAKDIVQIARVYSADVVVVTGLTSDLAHELTVDGLNTLATAQWVSVPSSGINGTGVWSGPKIDNLTPITELSRPGVDGAIESGVTQIGISVVQMDGDPLHPSSSWHSDLARLATRDTGNGPAFIVGDLNATPWQPAFRRLTGSGWRDAADVVGQGLRPTWPSWSPLPIAPLDHVLVRGGVGATSADTTNIAGSDHRALIVTLVLPNSGGD